MNCCGLTPYAAPTVRPWHFQSIQRNPSNSLVFTPPPQLDLYAFGWPAIEARAVPDATLRRRLRRITIKGDGRCLYRAIARGVAYEDGRSLPQKWEVEDADALRLLAYTIICKRKRNEYNRSMLIEGNVENYCRMMLNPKFFAGEVEMREIADALKRPISVYIPQQGGSFRNIVTYGEKWKAVKSRKAVRVLYNGHNHYDLLVQQ